MARYKIKRKKRKIKLIIISLIIIGLFALYYFLRIAPVMTTVVKESVKMQVSKAIDDMTDSELQTKNYEDFVITRYNDEGYLSVLQINSVNVDLFARKVTALIREEMSEFEKEGVRFPLGTITGLPFLSGIGPELELNLINLGIVDADFFSEFSSAGINQTIHKLYMRIVVNMTIVLPGYTTSFENSSQVIICESIISGKVPLGDIAIGSADLLP